MAFDMANACLMYADECAMLASSEAYLQSSYLTLAEVSKAEGVLTSMSKTKASVYRACIKPGDV